MPVIGPIDLSKLMQGGDDDDAPPPPSIEEWAKQRIEFHKKKVALFEKALAEIQALDARKWDRIYQYTQGNDPDAPTEKVGPHGAGCTCPTEEEELSGKTEPTQH